MSPLLEWKQLEHSGVGYAQRSLVSLKLCTDIDCLDYTISLGHILNSSSYSDVSDSALHAYLDWKVSEFCLTVALNSLEDTNRR